MAGHSKWANIKHRKAAQDKKRGKIFTRIIKEITIAARDGGGDPDTNPGLRLAIQNGKGANMPKDTIERAIKKGVGGDGVDLQELTFEGYANNGVAIFVECTTDNNNRTIAAVRSVFNKNGGTLGTNGSLSFVFDRKGVFVLDKEVLAGKEMDELEMELIDGGLEELVDQGEEVILYTAYDDFGNMQKHLESMNLEVKSADLQRIPNSTKELGVDDAKQVLKFVDKMEDVDDVNTVYHNLGMTDDLQTALEAEE